MDVNLDFLKNVELKPIEKLAPKRKKRTEKLPPDDVAIRIFASGKVFPSKKFAETNDLEYQDREVLSENSYAINGNGLDVFSSKEWNMYPDNAEEHFLFAYIVPKAYPKVSLFASTKYDDDNSPKNSVFTQGNSAFVKNELLDMLADVYGVNWDVKEYVDLMLVDQAIESPNGVYHIPKLVTSGKNKGQHTFIRRDNIVISPLILKEDVMNTQVKDAEEVSSESEPDVSGSDAEGIARANELPFPNESQAETQETDWSKLGS